MKPELLYTCPRCSNVLDRMSASGVEVDVCAACGGIWLDKGELAALDVNASRLDLDRLKPQAKRRAPPTSSAVHLRCPACSGTLSALPVANVALDLCEDCQGLWLDTGELDVALKALESKANPGVIEALTGVVRHPRSQ